jgi:hypothetical protein
LSHPWNGAAALRATVGAMLVCLSVSGNAAAAGGNSLPPGVHVDPGSPAAKEYAIPLGKARGNGSGSNAGVQTLFGSGIKAQPPSGGSGSGVRSPGTARTGSRVDRTQVKSVAGQRAATGSRARRGRVHNDRPISAAASQSAADHVLGSDHGPGTGVLWMVLAGGAVLLLGGVGSVLAGRRLRGPSTS